MTSTESGVKHLPLKLVLATVAMFGFGFALVPLYDVFCDLTGINGKGFERADITATNATPITQVITPTPTQAITQARTESVIRTPHTREIKVQFIAQPQTGFSGDFYPHSTSLTAPLNTSVTTAYVARNASNQTVQLQAVPSISPSEAATHITKMECFCFQQQSLLAGQAREMGLTFSIKEDLPEHIQKVTFSYALYAQDSTASGSTRKNITQESLPLEGRSSEELSSKGLLPEGNTPKSNTLKDNIPKTHTADSHVAKLNSRRYSL